MKLYKYFKYLLITFIFIGLQFGWSSHSNDQTYEDKAFIHLIEEMDKYHRSFDIYTDMNAGGNHYVPSRWMGDITRIQFNQVYTESTFSGTTCIKVSYLAGAGVGWAAIRWIDSIGFDFLRGRDTLYFMARGLTGTEIVRFEVGGEPGEPTWQLTVPLTNNWTRYRIPLTGTGAVNLKGGFTFVVERAANPNGCTFFLDDIKFNVSSLDSIRLVHSYVPLQYPNDRYWASNQAYTYDNALAMLAFLAGGTNENIKRARIIGDALQFCQTNDRYFTDGRLRNAYSSGDIISHSTRKARLPGWYDVDSAKWFEDEYQVGTYTGEMAWIIIAWLTYDHITGTERYRNSAISLAQWIKENCYDTTGIPGYTGGFLGWEPIQLRERWKSTEQNVDVYAAFMRLYQVTRNVIWEERANKALAFAKSMWDSTSNHFWSGTTVSDSINYFSPLDAQTFALLSTRDVNRYGMAITWVENNCRVDTLNFQGFHFSTVRDGIWWEGTGQMCLAFQVKGESAKSDTFLNRLRRWQVLAPNANGKGIVATCPDSIWTGIIREWGKWFYYDRLHVGATAWYIFAERNYNPFRHEPTTEVEEGRPLQQDELQFYLYQNYPNPFNPSTSISFSLPTRSFVSLKVFDLIGREVATLVNDEKSAGTYNVKLDASKLPSGVYFYRLQAGKYSETKKLVLLR